MWNVIVLTIFLIQFVYTTNSLDYTFHKQISQNLCWLKTKVSAKSLMGRLSHCLNEKQCVGVKVPPRSGFYKFCSHTRPQTVFKKLLAVTTVRGAVFTLDAVSCSFSRCKNHCAAQGGKLAEPETLTAFRALKKMVKDTEKEAWIGLKNPDGSVLKLTNDSKIAYQATWTEDGKTNEVHVIISANGIRDYPKQNNVQPICQYNN